jgi:hypothetical protein
MNEVVRSPWSPEQVEALRAYQTGGVFHELTCPMGHGALEVTPLYFVCPVCDYRQGWVPWMCLSAGFSHTHPEWWKGETF